jgi:hypothetical protein
MFSHVLEHENIHSINRVDRDTKDRTRIVELNTVNVTLVIPSLSVFEYWHLQVIVITASNNEFICCIDDLLHVHRSTGEAIRLCLRKHDMLPAHFRGHFFDLLRALASMNTSFKIVFQEVSLRPAISLNLSFNNILPFVRTAKLTSDCESFLSTEGYTTSRDLDLIPLHKLSCLVLV